MLKITDKMLETFFGQKSVVAILSLPPAGWKFNTRTGGHELDRISIGVWKYVRTGINAYLKNQVESHSKIDNSGNNQKTVQKFQVYFIQVLEGKYK